MTVHSSKSITYSFFIIRFCFEDSSSLEFLTSFRYLPFITYSLQAPYSLDANLFHTSYESGMLEDAMVS